MWRCLAAIVMSAHVWRRRRSRFLVRGPRSRRRNRRSRPRRHRPAARVSAGDVSHRRLRRAHAATSERRLRHQRGSRFSNLSGSSVPRLLRCGAWPALLHLRCDGSVCRRRDVLPHATGRTWLARLQRTTDPHVRGRALPRRDDGVSTWCHREGLDVGRIAGISESRRRRVSPSASPRS